MAVGYQALVQERNKLNAVIRSHQTVRVRSFIAYNKNALPPKVLRVYEKLEAEMAKSRRDFDLIDHYIELIMLQIED